MTTETLEDLQRKIRNMRRQPIARDQARMGYALAARWLKRADAYASAGDFAEADDSEEEGASIRRWAESVDPRAR